MSKTSAWENVAAAGEEHDIRTARPGTTRFLVAPACRHGGFPRRVEVPLEEYDEGQRRLVRAYLPEADPDRDITVSLRGRVLRFRCRRRIDVQDCDRHVPHAVTFDIVLTAPPGTRPADVTAEFADGMLLVSLPQ